MGCGVSLMGITPAAHHAGERFVTLIEQRLVIGGLLIVDKLVGLLQLLELFPDVRLIHAAKGLFAKFHGGQLIRNVLHSAGARAPRPIP